MLKFKAVAHMWKMMTTKSARPPATPEAVRKLLRPLESFEVESASASDDDEGDVEDVFEDIHSKGYPDPRKSINTNAKKIEANEVVAELFTEDHKRTISAVRNNTEGRDSGILSESIRDIMDVFGGPRVNYQPPEDVLQKIADILSDPDQIVSSPRQTEVSAVSYDYMSGVWNMLEAECKGKGFNVTPHNFDIYKQDEPHWLEKPDFPLEALDKSRAKCEKWLHEQQDALFNYNLPSN